MKWSSEEKKMLGNLNSPYKIQQFLDECNYNSTPETRSPRFILHNRRAHCLEGAMFAAACFEFSGIRPLVVDLKAFDDDDHVIAVYRSGPCWGAVAKSNFTTLRYREPVYRNLRELAMSYFDFYFNTLGHKSLRAYSLPQNLSRFERIEWRTTDADLEEIGYFLDEVKHFALINNDQIERLEKATPLLLESSMMGSDPDGMFIPGSGKKIKS
jgi:hypothetical protein